MLHKHKLYYNFTTIKLILMDTRNSIVVLNLIQLSDNKTNEASSAIDWICLVLLTFKSNKAAIS